MAVTETSRCSEDDLVDDPLSLGVDELSFDRFLEKVSHAAGVEAGVAMASHVLKNLVWVDAYSSLAVAERPGSCPGGGLGAEVTFTEGFERCSEAGGLAVASEGMYRMHS
jgi:hypothetical protein